MQNKHIFAGANLIKEPPKDFNRGNWATIDPGDNTAVVDWERGRIGSPFTYRHSLLTFSGIAVHKYTKIIIENVELFGGSSISHASAVKGDLFKLSMEIGALISDFRKKDCTVYLVNPRTWKGQLNYKQLRFILKEKFNIVVKNDHEASAIGIGLWAKGIF
jgi:hypothetical protein